MYYALIYNVHTLVYGLSQVVGKPLSGRDVYIAAIAGQHCNCMCVCIPCVHLMSIYVMILYDVNVLL